MRHERRGKGLFSMHPRNDTRAAWDSQYVADLPDAAFAVILPGGTKDAAGKTSPRSLRTLPHHTMAGAVDATHMRAAMASEPGMDLPPAMHQRAHAHLMAHAEAMGMASPSGQEPAMNQQHRTTPAPGGVPAPVAGIEVRQLGATGLDLEQRGGSGPGAGLPHIVGYASVFDSPTTIGGPGGAFTEIIRSGAFASTIAQHDIAALFNHDENLLLGRTKSGTLVLTEDRHGLKMDITPPATSLGRDLVEMVKRGDISGASFGFQPIRQKWQRSTDDEPALRELLEVRLFDVSPVVFPAYADTEVSSRAIAWARRGLAGDALADEELEAIRRLLASERVQHRSVWPGGPGRSPSPFADAPRRTPTPDDDDGMTRRRQQLEAIEASLAPPTPDVASDPPATVQP